VTPRAVITGVGVVAPSGIGAATHWRTVLAGEHRLGPISLFDPTPYPTRLAGQVPDFDATRYADQRRLVQTDRWTHLGFAATALALADAGLPEVARDPYRHGVALASSSGGNLFGQRELQRLWSQPARTVGAYQSIAWFYAATVGQLSIHHQFKGACAVLAAEAAGGLDSLAHAGRAIRHGTPVMIAGGTECPLSPYALTCQIRNGLLSTVRDPERAYRPFDVDATGYVPGEGGAVFVVEDLHHARERGAPHIYAEVAGWAAGHDARHTTVDGGGDPQRYATVLRLALERAGTDPDEVDLVVPDALGVPAFDRSEAQAFRLVFGARTPPVSTQKPLIGRAHQGASAIDVATALLAMRHGVLPVSAGPARPAAGCELDFVRATRPARLAAVLVGARGYDGFNSAVLLRAVPDRTVAGTATTSTDGDGHAD
jgi:minimal PKS chain-length factor (CLF/KS beta)